MKANEGPAKVVGAAARSSDDEPVRVTVGNGWNGWINVRRRRNKAGSTSERLGRDRDEQTNQKTQ